ncbi:MAG: hypothetical protein ACPL7B_11455, partial [Candidatus Poribacteria bacterium]
RVIQTYGGMVYMDFDRNLMETKGYGLYEPMDAKLLPNMFLAYTDNPGKDSGKMHNEVRFRFNQGDKEIINAMATFASYALEAKQALEERDHKRFAKLMNMNFDLRRKIYGDKAIGEQSLRMIEIARSMGAPSKFPGSGGAVIGIFEDDKHFNKLREAYLSYGFRFIKIMPNVKNTE